MADHKWVYDFAEGSKDMRELLGGKGANVAEMTRVLGPERVPAGFTITTEACVAYMRDGREPDGLDDQVADAMRRLEETAGKQFGDDQDPLLVSVRSGARESMPGMLDTILNVGLNDEAVAGLASGHRQRTVRLGFLPPAGADVRQRRRWRRGRPLRGCHRQRQARRRRGERCRAAGRLAEGPGRRVQGLLRLPPGPAGAAPARDPRGVRLLDGRARGLLPADQPDPRRLGNRGQRPADGVRQQGRRLRDRGRVQPGRGDRGARAERRLPRQRPGRGRGLRRAYPARHLRAGRRHARGLRAADGDHAHARGRIQGHAGRRVHGRGRAAVHAPDPERRSDRRRPRCGSRSTRYPRAC